jgi:hypothetical protein
LFRTVPSGLTSRWRGRVQLQRCSPARCGVPRVFEMSAAGEVVHFTCDQLMFVESMCSHADKYSPLAVGFGYCKIAIHECQDDMKTRVFVVSWCECVIAQESCVDLR